MRSCPSTDLILVSQYDHHVIWALFTGRGPPADSAMVPLHPVLLQQPGRMEKTSASPGQYHDQRNGEKWRNWQGIQSAELSWPEALGCSNSLERKMIRENWGVTVTWVLPCPARCFVCVASPHTVRPSVVRQCFFLKMETCKVQLSFLFYSFKIQSSSCKEQWQWFDSWQQIVIKQV